MRIVNQTFYGRKDELDFLFDAWMHTRDGKPQWISFVAETGAGKTRLIHEFYRYISDRNYRQTQEVNAEDVEKFQADFDPSNYWPSSLPMSQTNLGLNPHPEDLTRTKIESFKDIPWLWWGIRGDNSERRNGSENGCAASDALIHLEVHAALLALRRARIQNNLAAIQQIGKWFAPKIPVVGPMIEIALTIGELVQSGKRPLETLLKGFGVELQEEKNKLQMKLQDLLVDSIFKFLDEDVPVVLVLDDVHLFDVDSIAFVDRLVARLGEQSLKLMIISTSWAKEWNASPIRTIFNDFRGTAHEEFIRGMEAKYIQDFFFRNFPGLSEADLVLLAERANCNFRYATEILLALDRDPSTFFEDEETTSGLSATGREEIASKNLEMDSLIEVRFLGLDKTIQKALMRSSYQGGRFDPRLTAAVTLAVDQSNGAENAVMEAIRLAEQPGAMVSSIEADLREFLHGPYWRLIRTRQNKRKDFEAIQDAYRQVLSTGEADSTDSIVEPLILQWFEIEQSPTEKIRLRAWLLRIAAKSRRYQAGLHHLEQLAFSMSELAEDKEADRALSGLSPETSLAALYIFNQYAFGASNREHQKTLEKLCERFCLTLQAPIFKYIKEKTLPDNRSLPELIEWCAVLVDFRKGMGHVHDYLRWLHLLCELQKSHLEFGAVSIDAQFHYLATIIRFGEARAPWAENKAGWDQIFDIFQQAQAQVGRLEGVDRTIAWVWLQMSIIYFGKVGRGYYPADVDWGNDYANYAKCADKLADVLADIEHDNDGAGDGVVKFNDDRLEALLHAATLTVEYGHNYNYPVAAEFLDQLRFLAQTICDRIQHYGHVSVRLAYAAMEADLAVAHMLDKLSAETGEAVPDEVPDIPGIIPVYIKSREVGSLESMQVVDHIFKMADRYRELGMLSMDMINIFARASYGRLVWTDGDTSSVEKVFFRMVDDAILTEDCKRAAYGEPVQSLPWLVRIFDKWLVESPNADMLWDRLRESYSCVNDKRFDALIQQIREVSIG